MDNAPELICIKYDEISGMAKAVSSQDGVLNMSDEMMELFVKLVFAGYIMGVDKVGEKLHGKNHKTPIRLDAELDNIYLNMLKKWQE